MTVQFEPLPVPTTADGDERLIGVEIEFAELTEKDAAHVLADTLGGEAVMERDPIWTVKGSSIGDIDVYLDTQIRKKQKSELRDLALKIGREVVPVEMVTEPLTLSQLTELDGAVKALREAGAKGSGDGWFYGFGVHLNVQIAGEDTKTVLAPLLAYALIEDWMRAAMPIDRSRRALPWTEPYPTKLVSNLIDLPDEPSADQLVGAYMSQSPDRNRGLDMLPIFKHLWPDSMRKVVDDDDVDAASGRPTYHFRLPDCLIDEEDWSLKTEWKRWLLVEKIAGDQALLDELSAAWRDEHGMLTLTRQPWAEACGKILDRAGVTEGFK